MVGGCQLNGMVGNRKKKINVIRNGYLFFFPIAQMEVGGQVLRLFSRLGKQVMRMNACSMAMIRDEERLGGFRENGWSLSHHSQPNPASRDFRSTSSSFFSKVLVPLTHC